MLGKIYSQAKSFLRPITRHRKLLERAKYRHEQVLSPQEGNDLLARTIHQPAAIGKMGAVELGAVRPYMSRADSNGHQVSWGWHVSRKLYRNAGVYPPESSVISQFCKMYTKALTHLDVLAVYFSFGENAAYRKFAPKAILAEPRGFEPYYHDRPWSQHLAGKRVLVVSPFTDTIQAQYRRRQQVWRTKPEMLPDFQLLTLRCPLSAFLATPAYPDWCAALDAMREQMASTAFDVAIVGAGAWSLSLVSHAKSLGAWAIHLGGATQILFGIKGGRWDTHPEISGFYNEAWTRPSPNETPQGVQKIEGGCYW
jgi:hypothetical protein